MPLDSEMPHKNPDRDRTTVSVVIPCRNESRFLNDLLASIARQTFPCEHTELIFVDGKSTDGTLEILQEFAASSPRVQVLSNPAQFVPQAMNLGIRHSNGEYIVRLDAHATYVDNYLEILISSATALHADNVGCVFRTEARSRTPRAQAIAFALAHPLGVGNSLFRIGVTEPTEADTVPFGCYRREVLDRVGHYDERLIRNQDIELNRRLRRAGGRIFLLPEIGGTYFCRENYRQLWANNWENGKWVVLTAAKTNNLRSLSIRHFVPLAFVIYLATLPAVAWLAPVTVLPLAAYLTAIICVASSHFARLRDAATALHVALSFPILHISYGLGSLAAIPHLFRTKKPSDG
jgi:glycosyltransferase involved in cell wall biosynthesis